MTQKRTKARHGAPLQAEPGRHSAAVAVLEAAIEPIASDMGYELLLVEWAQAGKRRILRVFLDRPEGISVGDCGRMGRLIGDGLDAAEAAGLAGEGDPALAGLLRAAYTLEVSSPGVDRPLSKRRHFAAHIGGRVKVKTWESPLEAEANERSFSGRIVSVEPALDPADPSPVGSREGSVVIHDAAQDRNLNIPLPLIRRANLVWEG